MKRHPLQNASLAPYGFVTSLRRKRLEWDMHEYTVHEERLIARLWERYNRTDAMSSPPIAVILHKLLPEDVRHRYPVRHDFSHQGLGYNAREIRILSSTIQWFGTNVGRCFLETNPGKPGSAPEMEFVRKLDSWLKESLSPGIPFFTHECNGGCGKPSVLLGGLRCCNFLSSDASERDERVVYALMTWLGTRVGRMFIADFMRLKTLLWGRARRHQHAAFERRRIAL